MATNNSINTAKPIGVASGGTGLATLTAHSVQIGAGTSTITQAAVGTNGQVLVGATTADPVFATLTSSASTITYTTGANTLNLEVTNPVKVVATDNTGAGSGALANVTVSTGNNNTAFGFNALNANTTGLRNTAVGTLALASNQTLSSNTALGYNALNALTGGSALNTAIGQQAMATCVQDSFNTAVGVNALYSLNSGANTANQNTAIGCEVLQAQTTGANNTAMGFQAGYNGSTGITTGSNNILIGQSAGNNYTSSETGNVIIGSQGTVGDSNTIRIGGIASQTKCFIIGINGVSVTGSAVMVNSSGQLGVTVSSERYKDNIQDMDADSSSIMDLRPVTFSYKSDESNAKQFGLIAEEVEKLLPDLVVKNAEGLVETVKYLDLIPMLLNELIKLKSEVALLKKS